MRTVSLDDDPTETPSDASEPARLAHLAAVSVRELGTLVHLAADTLTPFPRHLHADRGALPPVVLVHGFLARAPTMRPLARALHAAGALDLDLVDYPSTRVDLDDIIDAIARVALPLARRHGRVAVVGHSLGAFATRAWIKAYGGDRVVSAFVSLGGPHAGTALWPLLTPRLRRALRPGSPWIERLADAPEPVPTTVVRAAYDHQVFPPVRARIPGVDEHVVLRHGHNGLLVAPEVHRAVVAALRPYGSAAEASS